MSALKAAAISAVLTLILVAWAVPAYVLWDVNPANWDVGTRGSSLLLAVIGAIIAGAAPWHTIKELNRK